MEPSNRSFLAYLDEMNIITILLPLSYHGGRSSSFSLTNGTQEMPLKMINVLQMETNMKYIAQLEGEIQFGVTYWICDEFGGKTDLQIGAVIRSDSFDEKFYYDGNDLGVSCENDQTFFKLWAPTATHVKLKLRAPKSTSSEIIKMKREENGIWAIVVFRDLEYYQYTFLVQVNQEWREAVDPYAVAATAGGEEGVIVKLEKTRRKRPVLPPFEHPVDALIYETHIRDLTIHPNSGVENKGLYLGAGEIKTSGKKNAFTGLSYIKNLGITHIEFLPFHDFAGEEEMNGIKGYNWGYNPIHFNVPEGSYSTDPANPYSRIIELKELIANIHHEGLRVIMDVVYNHVYIREKSNFEKVVPGYYFRHNEFGLPANGTGVGNDIASERKMVRKYIVDSIRFWLEEYHIDGFRFDLMGIMDIETITAVRETCDQNEDTILLIGEGWNLNTPLPLEKKAIIWNQAKLPTVGQFNDTFRDAIKGSTFNLYDKGFALGNEHYFEAAAEGIAGSVGVIKKEKGLFLEPLQTVNYVECHDNHTMWDKLLACLPDSDDSLRMKYHRLATSLVLLSQGIPFLHSGQEFFRTKYGDGNSYRSPDSINQLDWDRMVKFGENVRYIQGLIQIRKEFTCFRLRTAADIRRKMHLLPLSSPIIGYSYQNESIEFSKVLLFINPHNKKQSIQIPEGEWTILANHHFSAVSSKQTVESQCMIMEPICINLFAKK